MFRAAAEVHYDSPGEQPGHQDQCDYESDCFIRHDEGPNFFEIDLRRSFAGVIRVERCEPVETVPFLGASCRDGR